MPAREGFRRSLPEGGVRSAMIGGNTIGAVLREAAPRADGHRHLDTPAMIARLRALGLNHYFLSIWDSPTDWDDLRLEFLPAAAEAGIDVWPYLVPPSETMEGGKGSHPYLLDYHAWAKAVAELSLEHRNLTAWSIDDFEFELNAELFTPEYMTEMRRIQDAINPDLGFLTCAYYAAATDDAFLAKYAPYVDGIVYPFLDGPNLNTVVADTAGPDLDAILEHTRPLGLEVILLVYAGRFLDSPLVPQAGYVADAVRTGLAYAARGDIAGVVAYGTQIDDGPAPSAENRALYGAGRLALTSSSRPVAAGAYVEASQDVAVDPDAPRHELSFWHNRTFLARQLGARGDLSLRVLLDDTEVWTCDAFDENCLSLWLQGKGLQGPVDVSAQLRGRTSARLTFRLVADSAHRGFPVDVGVDHLETIGFTVDDPGFETGAPWRIASSGGALVGRVERYAADRPAQVFAAVAEAYRS